MILAFDPGLRHAGAALFCPKTKQLVRAALITNTEETARDGYAWTGMASAVMAWVDLDRVTTLVIEVPQIYKGAAGYGVDPDDLIQLAGVDGAVCGLWPDAKFFGYRPPTWKGQVPKNVHNRRIMTKLTDEEKARFEPCAKSLVHNLVDAVGLGLYQVGRKA